MITGGEIIGTLRQMGAWAICTHPPAAGPRSGRDEGSCSGEDGTAPDSTAPADTVEGWGPGQSGSGEASEHKSPECSRLICHNWEEKQKSDNREATCEAKPQEETGAFIKIYVYLIQGV